MIFRESDLPGVFEISLDPKQDERGFFARTWCSKEALAHGLNPRLEQCNISFNTRRHTLRGMHWQAAPFAEAKLIRGTSGALWDVVIDLRPESPAFGKWDAFDLTPGNRKMVYVPERCGHGFLTLEDDTEVFYQMSQFYCADAARGARWNDPAFQIAWPHAPEVISDRDANYPDFESGR
jgi:dTDP-4-dehydrorhamnose 3,5-epimerase